MDLPQFWHLVDSTRGQPDRAERLSDLLQAHTPDEIVQFRLLYDDLLQTANHVDLWGAANTINGHCAYDDFIFFREALIERGRKVFEAAVANPDSLADVAVPGQAMADTDGLGNAPAMAWAARTGGTEEAFFEAVDATDTRTDRGDAETGASWDFEDPEEVRLRLPQLAARFLSADGD